MELEGGLTGLCAFFDISPALQAGLLHDELSALWRRAIRLGFIDSLNLRGAIHERLGAAAVEGAVELSSFRFRVSGFKFGDSLAAPLASTG